jgi:glycosyltransferase involved in cell wall biosynthesis
MTRSSPLLETICEPPIWDAADSASDVSQVTARPARNVRVLHVINGEHFSGAERVQDLLALNLPSFGYEVGFACLKSGRFAALRQSQASPIVDLGMKSRYDLRPPARLARLVRDEGYALIHTHTPRAALVGRLAASLAGVPLVHHVHSPTATDSTRTIQNLLNTWTERFSLIGVSGVVAVSRSLADYAESQGISRSRISVVQNGVPARGPLFDRRPPPGTWTLGAVALFRQRKGLEVLLDALARLRSQGIDARLRAVGEFEMLEYERKIKHQVERLNIGQYVDWVGFTDDAPAELAKMDLFVLPSLFGEGLPMVILEAMAAGVPVVATRVEGVPEAIRDELDGLIARPNDAQSLADTIARVIHGEADWSQLRTNAHRHHAACFSDRSMAQGVARVYKKVLRCS